MTESKKNLVGTDEFTISLEYDKIWKKLKDKKISCEQALEALAEIGFSPNLLNDDNGHWAVVFDGLQSIAAGPDREDCMTTAFVRAENWKDSIYDALVHSLEV